MHSFLEKMKAYSVVVTVGYWSVGRGATESVLNFPPKKKKNEDQMRGEKGEPGLLKGETLEVERSSPRSEPAPPARQPEAPAQSPIVHSPSPRGHDPA